MHGEENRHSQLEGIVAADQRQNECGDNGEKEKAEILDHARQHQSEEAQSNGLQKLGWRDGLEGKKEEQERNGEHKVLGGFWENRCEVGEPALTACQRQDRVVEGGELVAKARGGRD